MGAIGEGRHGEAACFRENEAQGGKQRHTHRRMAPRAHYVRWNQNTTFDAVPYIDVT
jgi:hypothetical protein